MKNYIILKLELSYFVRKFFIFLLILTAISSYFIIQGKTMWRFCWLIPFLFSLYNIIFLIIRFVTQTSIGFLIKENNLFIAYDNTKKLDSEKFKKGEFFHKKYNLNDISNFWSSFQEKDEINDTDKLFVQYKSKKETIHLGDVDSVISKESYQKIIEFLRKHQPSIFKYTKIDVESTKKIIFKFNHLTKSIHRKINIETFEKEHDISLPEDYRNYVLKYGGSHSPNLSYIKGIDNAESLSTLLDFGDKNEETKAENSSNSVQCNYQNLVAEELVSPEVIPIFNGTGGHDYVFLIVKGSFKGTVIYGYDYSCIIEQKDKLILQSTGKIIANSFTEFINEKLYITNDAILDEADSLMGDKNYDEVIEMLNILNNNLKPFDELKYECLLNLAEAHLYNNDKVRAKYILEVAKNLPVKHNERRLNKFLNKIEEKL